MTYFKNKKKQSALPEPRGAREIDQEYNQLAAKLGELTYHHDVLLPGKMQELKQRIFELMQELQHRQQLDAIKGMQEAEKAKQAPPSPPAPAKGGQP